VKISMFQVDAFTGDGLRGNRAAVCLLDSWLPDEVLQALAERHALSETAYLVPEVGAYDLRWFTPTTEVDLCGHATLASAYVVLTHLEPGRQEVSFRSRSGTLGVRRRKDLYVLDFPRRPPHPAEEAAEVAEAMGLAPKETWATPRDWLLLYESEEEVGVLEPDMALLATFDRPGVIATAPGDHHDFVSRFFAPGLGVPEDPVTGSAHCTLTPFWAERLGKKKLHAVQISAQGGELFCEEKGDRVAIGGRAEPFIEGTVEI